jgi:hypothetical protein
MSPHEKVELVDEDALPVGTGAKDWPDEDALLTPPPPADLPEETPGDPGSDFYPVDDDSEPTDPGWAESSADIDPSEFEDDGLLERQE